MEFKLSKKDGGARLGVVKTAHGDFTTPAFMTVGTKGFIKTINFDQLKNTGAQIFLANTYHLYLRPGLKVIENAQGLHNFIGYSGPILTDSGGYQVFSLGRKRGGKLAKIDELGVTFTSHYDGSTHRFTPKKVIDIQTKLGVDIAMPLDDCAEAGANSDELKRALQRTHNWLAEAAIYWRSLKSKKPALFGIVQGGTNKTLRAQSAEFVANLNLDGNAIGGLAVGESKKKLYETIEYTANLLPTNKPRYLMGVGEPEDIMHAIKCGIDMFDCVLPTRLARHGVIWQLKGKKEDIDAFWELDTKKLAEAKKITIEKHTFPKAKYQNSDENEEIYNAQERREIKQSFINHLYKEKEIGIMQEFTLHNLTFIQNIIKHSQNAIRDNKYEKFCQTFGIK